MIYFTFSILQLQHYTANQEMDAKDSSLADKAGHALLLSSLRSLHREKLLSFCSTLSSGFLVLLAVTHSDSTVEQRTPLIRVIQARMHVNGIMYHMPVR